MRLFRRKAAHHDAVEDRLGFWAAHEKHTIELGAHALDAGGGPTEEWFADLELRMDQHEAEDGVGIELAHWARFRAHETDAVARRLEAEGPAPEWFEAIDRRIDEMERSGAVPECGDDDSATVAAVQRSLRLIARPERTRRCRATNGIDRVTTVVDRAVSRVERREAAWLRLFSHARPGLVGAVAAFAVAAAVCAAVQLYAVALALVLGATGADLLEGAVGRVSGTESPEGRWFAGLASHVADVAVVVGVAVAQIHAHHAVAAAAVFIAAVCGLLGSLARTLAREVGVVLWSSAIAERAVRLAATVGCLGLSLAGDSLRVAAPWYAAVLFGGYGVWEMARVAMRIHRHYDSPPVLVRGRGGTPAYLPAAAGVAASGGQAFPAPGGPRGPDDGGALSTPR